MNDPEPAPAAPGDGSAASTIDYPAGFDRSVDRIELGPGLDPDLIGRLIGHVSGRRILELGCGDGSNAVAMALAGAKVISVDSSADRLTAARELADAHDVRVEFHHSDLADLAFIRGDQIDLALVIYSLIDIVDIARVFRQVNRVLRTDASIVVSLPHPIEWATMVEDEAVVLHRSLFDGSPVETEHGSRIPHSVSDVFVALSRSNFRVDHLMEPQISAEVTADPARHELHPASIIFRGRKQGS